MGNAVFANRASAPLASAITSGAASLTVAAGKGALFPVATGNQYFGAVIQKGALDTDAREYVYCARAAGSDTITLLARGQEGSTAQAFAAGDVVARVLLAGEFDAFMQRDDISQEIVTNGGFAINQRGISTTSTHGVFIRDRWRLSNAGAAVLTHALDRDVPAASGGYGNAFLTVSTARPSLSAGDFFLIEQVIEALRTLSGGFGAAGAKTLNVGLWIKSSQTGTIATLALRNAASNRSLLLPISVVAANTWEWKEFAIPGDTAGTWNNSNLANAWGSLSMCFASGSTFASATTGSWLTGNYVGISGVNGVSVANATVRVTGVTATFGKLQMWKPKDTSTDLLECSRYYGTGNVLWVSSATAAGIDTGQRVNFRTQMRAVPTLTYGASSTANVTTYDARNPDNDGFLWYCVATAAGSVRWAGSWAADAEL